VTGPEAGIQFWQGSSAGSGGFAVGGQYANWNGGEPNNFGDEDYLHMIFNTSVGPLGSWNDLPNAGAGGAFMPQGYIVEYGGMPGDSTLQITGSATVNVVAVNDAPSTPTESNAATNTVAEGASNGSTVGVTARAIDPDGDTLTYSLTVNAGGRYSIDALTGVVTVADGSLLNYETATSHSITVQASDGAGGTSTESFTIAVTNVNPTTPTDANATSNTVAEGAANGTTVGVTASSSDPNGPAVTYSLTNNAGGRFVINSSTGVVTVANGTLLDYEAATSHSITVQASDGAGGTSSQSFTINLINLQATLSIGDVSVVEGDSGTTAMTFTVTLSSAINDDFTVNYATANGTAGNGTGGSDNDYVAASGTLNFNGTAGETRQITVNVNGDNKVESNQQLLANLSGVAGTNDVTIADGQGQGTITNDDSTSITINDVTQSEGDAGTTNFTFAVSMTNPVDQNVVVQVSTTAQSATGGGVDYNDLNTTVTFVPGGPLSQNVTVAVNGEQLAELNETFAVRLCIDEGNSLANVLHRYTFNCGANDSAGTANASLFSGASVSGGALQLDGSNDYAHLPIGSTIAGLNNATFEAWTTWDTFQGAWSRIFDFGSSTTVNMFLTPRNGRFDSGPATNTLRLALITSGGGGEQQATSASQFPVGVLTHVAFTIDDASNTGRLYVNGVQVAQNLNMTLTPASMGNTTRNYLGKSQYNDPFYDGSIDEFRIYNRALSAAEVTSSFQAGPNAGLASACL